MPRLTAISSRIINAGAKKSPVFIKIYSGTDFSSYHSTWTFSTGTISLRSTTLPYHSYGNLDELNTATNQSCNKTWPLRAGTNQGPILYTSTITTVSTTTNSSSIVLSSSVAGRDLGSDRSTLQTSWSFNNGLITLITDALPYHSYGDGLLNPNQPTRQDITAIISNRAGTNVAATTATTASNVVGYWLNGVHMARSAVGFTTVTEVTEYYPEWQYDSAFALNETSELVFNRDSAGGYINTSGQYQYIDFKFSNAWLTGNGYTSGTAPYAYPTGAKDVDAIPYLNGTLTHPNGHSKILGWALDGYPVYGPYGYSTYNNPNSGVRRMLSGYALNFTRDPINAKLPPVTQAYSDRTYTVTTSGSTAYLIDGIPNDTLDLKRGFTYTFNLSAVDHPFFIKTTATIGANDQYNSGVTNNGTQTGVITFVVPTDAPSTLYYTCEIHSSMGGTINISNFIPQTIYPLGTFVQDYTYDPVRGDLDEHNGRYCVTPDYPSGTYAYFVTVDASNVPVFPYVLGTSYYGNPQFTLGGLSVPTSGSGVAPTPLTTTTTTVNTTTVTTGTISTVASNNIGYWINGVNILNPSADAEAPNGYLSFATLHYNASYTASKYWSYSLEQDLAGGRVIPNGNYHYQDYSFAAAWASGSGAYTLAPTPITVGPAPTGSSLSSNSVSLSKDFYSQALVDSLVGQTAVIDRYPLQPLFYTVVAIEDEPTSPTTQWRMTVNTTFDSSGQLKPINFYPDAGAIEIVTNDIWDTTGSSVGEKWVAWFKTNLPANFETTVQPGWTINVAGTLYIVDYIIQDPVNSNQWRIYVTTSLVGGVGIPIFSSLTRTLSTGTAEVSIIPYLNNSIVQADGHSKLLGWSLDGYPIYGPYGYTQAMDCNSGVRPMTSGYTTYTDSQEIEARINEGALDTEVFPLGIFVEDWYFAGTGDLDISNGRYCVTPEYPDGTYAYFCSVDANTLAPTFPYVIGNSFKSTPVASGQTASDTTNRGGSAPKQTG